MSANELPAAGDWAAVDAVVHRLMKRLDMPLARLSRESGVSETTIRYLSRPEKRQRSTLVALSAALGCPHGYLVDVLHGTADAETPPPTANGAIAEPLRALNEKLTTIMDITGAIDTKLGVLLNRQP